MDRFEDDFKDVVLVNGTANPVYVCPTLETFITLHLAGKMIYSAEWKETHLNEDAYSLQEYVNDLIGLIDEYAPKDYYFGTPDDNPACLGFFPIPPDVLLLKEGKCPHIRTKRVIAHTDNYPNDICNHAGGWEHVTNIGNPYDGLSSIIVWTCGYSNGDACTF